MDLTDKTILHFQILGQIGRGGMSVVYKARDTQLERIVALKILHFSLALSEVDITRLEQEARAAAALNHSRICIIYGYYKTPEYAFIAMEYVQGETLKSCIKRTNTFSVEKAVHVVMQLAQALSVAHEKGIIHRDVKSDNIMITADGSVKLMDFGLARLKESPKLTRTGEVVGTAAYMSPEQAEGRPVDQRTDLWSLGVVFYEMLTGQLPFEGDSDISTLQKILKTNPPALRTFKIKVPRSVQYVLLTLLEKDIRYRYPDAPSVINDLRKSVSRSTVRLALRRVKKHLLKITVALLLIGIISAGAVYTIQKRNNIPPWLRQDAAMRRLTTENGIEHGSISPSGRYLAYVTWGLVDLRIKDLVTGQNILTLGNLKFPLCPVWYPDESRIDCANGLRTIMDIPIEWNSNTIGEMHPFFTCDSCYVHQLNWSPDGQWLSSLYFDPTTTSLWLDRSDGSVHRCLIRKRQAYLIIQSSWHPDSRHLSFYNYNVGEKSRSIRTMDILTGEVSDDLIKVHHMPSHWLSGGIAVAPDGRYLVYPDSSGDAMELFALPIKENGMKCGGRPIRLTHFSGNGVPYWPYFTKDGRALSFMLDASGQDIHVASFNQKMKRIGNSLIPVCTDRKINREGDWSPNGKSVAFISQQQNQMDIYLWNHLTQKVIRLTDTVEEEKTLRFLPDQPSIGFVCSDVIYALPVSGGIPRRIYPPVQDESYKKVYNYTWGKTADTLYVILNPGPQQPENEFPLFRVVLSQNTEEIIHTFRTQVRPSFEIRRSPNGEMLAYREVSTDKSDTLTIGVLDLKSSVSREVAYQYALTPNGQMSWTADGSSLVYRTNEPKGERHFYMTTLSDLKTEKLEIPERFEHTYPGLISPAGDEILLFTERDEVDIWSLGDFGNAITPR
jgi:serine/threonine protein kinase